MNSFPFYRQPDSMDCGPTCLQMVAKYYGKTVALQTLREKTQIGKDGVNILGISEAAESIGFRTRAVKLNYASLVSEALLPCILHWNQQHFVVLYRFKRRRLFIADPGGEQASLTPEEFLSRWISDKNSQGVGVGVALLLEPTPRFYEQGEASPIPGRTISEIGFRNVFHYLMPYKSLVLQLVLGLGIASLLQLILPFLTQSVIDVGVGTADISFIYIVLLAQLALTVGRLTVDFVRSWLLLHISTRVNISILTDFLIKFMRLPLSFFDSKRTGDILQRMNDHQRIESFLTGASINVVFSLANLVVFSVVLAIFNVHIFGVFISASILYSGWVAFFLKKSRLLDYKRFDVAAKEQSATIQMVQGMQEIKLNGVEKSMRWSWERLQAKSFRLNMKGLAINQWQQSGASFINESKNILISFLSAKAVIKGEMTLGAMLAVQYIIGQLNSPIQQMIEFLRSWQNARISMERLNEIHGMDDEEPEHQGLLQELPATFTKQLAGGKMSATFNFSDPGLVAEKAVLSGINADDTRTEVTDGEGIVFSDISFTYPGIGNEPVLKDINLIIPKGKITAIVGGSGSGKTTLLKLLLKFYEPQKGDIRLGNTALAGISHRIWRSHCGAVMQESFIFSDSIARNIAVGEEHVDPGKLRHAVHVANISEFIDGLPLGFNTMIGIEGVGISMGQKQRLLIARAVYRDPEFIFLDEATNSLDANNESIIVQNLASFLDGKTVVVVAHRLSTVKNADQIVVLKNGVIAERGTHQELVSQKGEYFILVKNQLELDE